MIVPAPVISSEGIKTFPGLTGVRQRLVDLLSQCKPLFGILLLGSLFAQLQEVLFVDRHKRAPVSACAILAVYQAKTRIA